MTTAYSILSMQPILLEGLSRFQTAATAFNAEPTRMDLQLPVRPNPMHLSSDIVRELISYEKLAVTPEEVVRFSEWLNERRLVVSFFTNAVTFLIQMRREEGAFDEEITQVRRRPVRRTA